MCVLVVVRAFVVVCCVSLSVVRCLLFGVCRSLIGVSW